LRKEMARILFIAGYVWIFYEILANENINRPY
jgi:hypothetical protein